jgi:hypothetical protein
VRPESLEARPTFGVVAARVVFCDAMAYDAGYVPVEDIAGRVAVRGRGGTVPRIRREHAFLIPAGAHLPFRARGPVFRIC